MIASACAGCFPIDIDKATSLIYNQGLFCPI